MVNAAGLQGDMIEAIVRPSPFQIKPRKGQFVVFDKPAARLITACIMPVPSERTKGMMVARTIFGNLLVGPTAEEQEDREHATVDRAALEALIARGQRILPGLAGETVTALYAGLRPATQFKDYQVEALPDRNWITAAGIRSHRSDRGPGHRTSRGGALSPGFRRAPRPARTFHHPAQSRRASAAPPRLRWLWRDDLPLRAGDPGRDRGCLGRAAPRRGSRQALEKPRHARRIMMGRCPGFYCSAKVAALAEGRLAGFPNGAEA